MVIETQTIKTEEEDEDLSDMKRRRMDKTKETVIKEEVLINESKVKAERCVICRQYLDELLFYNGHPNNSVEEFVALTDEKLTLFTGEENDVNEQDERPTNRVRNTFMWGCIK